MRRKEFLRILGGGLAGLGLLSRQARSGTLPVQPAREGRHWAWLGGQDWTEEQWLECFERMRNAGLDAVLLNTGMSGLAEVIERAKRAELEVHLWKPTLMQGEALRDHPEWYAVNRLGDSTAVKPPYVPYYRFLCPRRAPVLEFLTRQFRELARLPVAGLHFDYIRFPDVILPVALWPQYDLVQDREYPEFDYCYCEVCREAFQQQTGTDPLALEDPPNHAEWLQFRYDSITRIVNQLSRIVRAEGRQISAAVFPTPAIARRLVRQDWLRWNLDAIHPMIYHSFYNQPVSWIEQATREGVQALAGRFPLYAGLYVPELSPSELAGAARLALAAGASGVSLFNAATPTGAHWQALGKVLRAEKGRG